MDKLDHPNIVRTFERGEYRGKLFIAMEFLRGKTLARKITEEAQFPLTECLDIMEQVSGALAFIHDKNIIHRDMKPANIMMVTRNNNPNFVKLLDFGVALMAAQTRLTRSGMLVGTIHYTAPEQITENLYSTASDVYSMGVTFYEMLAGKPAFPQEAITALVEKILDETPPEPVTLRRDIPEDLNRLLMSMLMKNPDTRPSAEHVLEILKKIRGAVSPPTPTK